MRTIAFLITLAPLPCAGKGTDDLQIKAQEFLIFHIKEKKCTAKGSVQIEQGTTSFQSDWASVHFKRNKEKLRIQFFNGQGHAHIQIKEGVATGDSALYNADKKTITIKGKARLCTPKETLRSDHLEIRFSQTPQEESSGAWVLDSISSPGPMTVKTKDLFAKGKKGYYDHSQRKAFVQGDAHIWHNKNYVQSDTIIVDLEKQRYTVGSDPGRAVRSLLPLSNSYPKEKNGT